MDHLSTKGDQIVWRRDKVRELRKKGYTVRNMAAELQLPLTNINRDLKYLRAEAQQNISHYVDEYLPFEYQNALDALDEIIKGLWSMKAQDNKEQMQIWQLLKECYAMRVELTGSTQVIDRAVRFIHRLQDLGRGSTPQNNKVTTDVQPKPE